MKQYISELIDEELSAKEADEVIDQLLCNQSDRKAWAHYSLIGQVIRGEVKRAPQDLVASVAKRLESEPVVEVLPIYSARKATGTVSDKAAIWGSTSLLALAASIVLMAVIVTKPTSMLEDQGLAVTEKPVGNTVKMETLNQNFQQEMDGMLVEHGEFTSTMGLNGLLAYAKMVSSESMSR